MKCPECRKSVERAAVRCRHCSAWLDDRWIVGRYNVLVMKERHRTKRRNRLMLCWGIMLLFTTIAYYCEKNLIEPKRTAVAESSR